MSGSESEIFVNLLNILYLDGKSAFSSISLRNLEGAEGFHARAVKIILEGYQLFRTDWTEFVIDIIPERNWAMRRSLETMGVYNYESDTVEIQEDEFLKVVSVGFHEVAEREFIRSAPKLYPQLLGPEEYRTNGGVLSAWLFDQSHPLATVAQVLLTENFERCAYVGGRMRAATMRVLRGMNLGGMFFVQGYRRSRGMDFDSLVNSYAERWGAYVRQKAASN